MEHLGFIVDGNRRWAKEHGLPTLEGHTKGLAKIEDICEKLVDTDIKYASFYIFSTENWNRTKEEVDYLMALIEKQVERLAKKMLKHNAKCIILGSRDRVSPKLLKKLDEAEKLTKDCDGLTVCLCFNYGGKQEIVDAARTITKEAQDRCHIACHSGGDIEKVYDELFTIENFEKYIYHPEIPPVDMVVRTSGEERISGFMLWRAAYAEFFFLEKYWPDIKPTDISKILAEFNSRQRRFGK